MIIVADENMPHATTFFSRFGEVRLVHGRRITAETVRDADMLMVRSITRVNRELLEGSRVRFVGTATIGTDHVDQDWLVSQGIGFAAAPGCNADSVAQYMASALAWASGRIGRPLSECSIGIVGVGNCGSRVARVARAFGMRVVLNDPPLARQTGDPVYRPLDELLGCDFLALHVPLTKEGPDATWRLIDANVLGRLKQGAIVINACRGGVVDEEALCSLIDRGWLGGAIWMPGRGATHQPRKRRSRPLGTPHIAGYCSTANQRHAMIYERRASFGIACERCGGHRRRGRGIQLNVPAAPRFRAGRSRPACLSDPDR